MSRYFALLGVFLFLGTAVPVHAHANGLSVEEQVGDYRIDVGYDQQLVAGEQITFDFNLYNQRRDGLQEQADFTDVSFDIIFNSTPVFSRKVERGEPKTLMTAVLPTSGQYKFHVSYFRGEQKVVETEFTVLVADGIPKETLSLFTIIEFASYGFAALVIIVAGVGLVVTRARRKEAQQQG